MATPPTKPHPTKIVGYLRTSTEDQLLGMDAQQDRFRDIAARRRCDIEQVFIEHESGGNNDRPELDRAIRLARGSAPPWSSPSSTAWPATSDS